MLEPAAFTILLSMEGLRKMTHYLPDMAKV